jgi:hypothetical protein
MCTAASSLVLPDKNLFLHSSARCKFFDAATCLGNSTVCQKHSRRALTWMYLS